MKKLLSLFGILILMGSCNNSAGDNKSVGDSLDKDPQTGQPITTAPDTVGSDPRDSTVKKDEQNH